LPVALPTGKLCRLASPAKLRAETSAAADIAEVAGELRPEGGFERDVLAHPDHAEIGEHGHDFGDTGIEFAKAVGVERDRRVMLAEGGAPGGDLVLGEPQFLAQAHRLVLGRAHAAQREVHPRAPRRSTKAKDWLTVKSNGRR
jgi:hypothetical protein